jgi:membrane fusion protein (multidrug efflux system)
MSDMTVGRDAVAPPAPGQTLRARLRPLAITALVLAALGAAGAYAHRWWVQGRFVQGTDDAYVGGDVTAIAPHVAGFVVELPVADNQRVKAGQLLARLDPRDFRVVVDHARAAVAAREAALAGLRAQQARQDAMIRQQVAELAARSAQSTFTVQESDRYRILAQTSAGSRQDAQRSLALDRQAQAAVASARAGLEAARQAQAVLDAQSIQAQAEQAQAAADLRAAELNLGYTEIRAPVDGVVGNRAAQLGGYVAAGGYLLSVVPADGLWVDANFKEDQLARMRPGQVARVLADAAPGRAFAGRVLSLAPGTGAIFSVIPPENATGNFTRIVQRVPVRIGLDPADARLGALRPGLSVTVSVDTNDAP